YGAGHHRTAYRPARATDPVVRIRLLRPGALPGRVPRAGRGSRSARRVERCRSDVRHGTERRQICDGPTAAHLAWPQAASPPVRGRCLRKVAACERSLPAKGGPLHVVTVIPGDGIGPEVIDSALELLEA